MCIYYAATSLLVALFVALYVYIYVDVTPYYD